MNQQVFKLVHSIEVANCFLDLAESTNKRLTQMQLQKLVYITHGWHLFIFDCGLTIDEPEAWNYGPLYTSLWMATRKYGSGHVTERVKMDDSSIATQQTTECDTPDSQQTDSDSLSSRQNALIKRVFEVYGELGAFELSALTHQRKTPWYEVYVEQKLRREPIPQESIKRHFTLIAQKRHASKKT